MGVQPLSVSVDSVFVHKMWNDKELVNTVEGGIPYPMLSDQSGKVGTEYGVYDEDNSIQMRGSFIIDPDGIVQYYEVVNAPVGRDIEELKRKLEALMHVRETKGAEATPVGWKKGDKTLKPSEDLVGNVFKEWNLK